MGEDLKKINEFRKTKSKLEVKNNPFLRYGDKTINKKPRYIKYIYIYRDLPLEEQFARPGANNSLARRMLVQPNKVNKPIMRYLTDKNSSSKQLDSLSFKLKRLNIEINKKINKGEKDASSVSPVSSFDLNNSSIVYSFQKLENNRNSPLLELNPVIRSVVTSKLIQEALNKDKIDLKNTTSNLLTTTEVSIKKILKLRNRGNVGECGTGTDSDQINDELIGKYSNMREDELFKSADLYSNSTIDKISRETSKEMQNKSKSASIPILHKNPDLQHGNQNVVKTIISKHSSGSYIPFKPTKSIAEN